MSGLFEELISRYKAANIAFPSLKPVTVAQWILESGRGTSRLATENLNFAGLKWRSEMVGFATPVEYEAHDGLDFYCKFGSLDAFIVGYWKFISRSPYNGWEDRVAEGPEAFIRFIGPIYNPAGVTYVNQVLALVDEATQLLNAAPGLPEILPPPDAGTPVVIVLDPGHGGTVKINGSSPNNAKSLSGELEKDWTLDMAKRTRASIVNKAVALGKNVNVVLTRETDINKGLNARANVAKNKGAKLFLSIHFNGFNKEVRGVETLIDSMDNVNKAQDRALAQSVQDRLLAALNEIDPTTKDLPKYNRKVKEQKLGVLRDLALGNTGSSHPCSSCLVEIEFMDVMAVEQLFQLNAPQTTTAEQTARNRQKIADSLADALLAHV
jgi:N-acetylmuramoyl-L-alanine amidase